MTKKFFLFAVAALTLVFTGCGDTYDDGGYSEVYPGALIYNDVKLTSALATDGVSIAMRLAILMEEMEEAGLTLEVEGDEPDWDDLGTFTYEYSNSKCGKKEFLFGNTQYSTISRISDNEYRIEYGYDDVHAYYAYCYDLNIRRGAFVVNTNGVKLDQSDMTKPWTVKYADDSEGALADTKMTYMLTISSTAVGDRDGDDTDVFSNNSYTTIYYDSSSEAFNFICSFTGRSVDINTETEYPWSVMGSVSISNYVNLLIENTIDRKYSLELESYDEQYTYNASEISYYTESPLIYAPSEYLHSAVGGIEVAEYHNYTNTTFFPSSTVRVTTLSDSSHVYQYNGVTYEE